MGKIILGIVIAFCVSNIAIVNAQGPWQTTGNTVGATNFLGTTNGQALRIRTNNTQRMTILDGGSGAGTGFIGIGNNFSTPTSVVHINAVNNGTGEVFRTQSPANTTQAWRMISGNGAGVEKFRLYNPSNSPNVVFYAPQANATIRFDIQGATFFGGTIPVTRMIITDGSVFGTGTAPSGMVGIGNDFLNPQSQLHLNDGVYQTHLQITNLATNGENNPQTPAATDGFKVGIAADGTGEIREQENKSILVYTGEATAGATYNHLLNHLC